MNYTSNIHKLLHNGIICAEGNAKDMRRAMNKFGGYKKGFTLAISHSKTIGDKWA